MQGSFKLGGFKLNKLYKRKITKETFPLED